MAQLFDLPTETLLEVLSWLRGPRDIRTLLNLCLTSRRLRTIVQPCLFEVPPYLSGLKSLHIKDQAKTRHPNMKQLVEMMCLPELKEFSLAVCNGNGSGCPDFNLPPGSFRFSELQLLKATLSATQLTNIMRACNRLEVLVYESSMTWTNRRRTNSQFAAPELLRCLEPQKQNLKSLRVDLDVAEPIAIENWHRCPRYGSFREFENLKHLEVEQGILHEFRNLPPNIESVTVLSCDYPIYEMMDGLVQCYEVDFPCLENVFLRPKYPPASGMLDIPGTYSFSDLEEDYWFREQYKTGCCTLENIVDDVNFELEVDCDGWEMYKHGDL
ncbi:F-box protein [Aspergillus saccharolyticus JOP 1030-1]|uniref:F-box domain-containing protein n=1 Tax=Aspergillus saccharolyticus JOP 1030-1 TaxID=1450539 RepID=A0A318ZLU2_9EURO|nr:hypothetical protein BP01DRAFT_297838 [Aspergillus saccharolyticus JOP 1030-1]PYH44780.1 hypothetical protein BP01DRAFT_297838 [Aspergillus saccharolyticus JOP 1030-1]